MSDELLATLRKNLAELELQRAQFGLRVPIDLINEIRGLEVQIAQASSRPDSSQDDVKNIAEGRVFVDEQQRMYFEIDKKLSVLETQFHEMQRQMNDLRAIVQRTDADVTRIMNSLSPAGRLSTMAIVISVVAVVVALVLTILLSVKLL